MLKIGIVGCGHASARHASALMSMKDRVKIVGCCDVDSAALMDFKRRYSPEADVFTDMGAMLMQQKLDIVLLGTWPVMHHDQIMTALDAGVPNIVVEKPLTVTATEALDLFSAAQSRGTRIMESNAFMYQPRFRELDKLMTGSTPADTIHATFCQSDREAVDPSDFDLDWRRRKIYGGGVPWEFISFLITACNHFTKDLPVGVYAYGSRGRYDTITRMHGMIEYLHGGVAFIHSDKQSSIQEFRLRFKGGTVDVLDDCWFYDGAESRMTIASSNESEVKAFEGTDVFRSQWNDFLQGIDSDAEQAVPFIHSVVAMYTLDAMVASVFQQVSVELDIPETVMDAYEATLKDRGHE